jgi:hypothetical protein
MICPLLFFEWCGVRILGCKVEKCNESQALIMSNAIAPIFEQG